MKITEITFFDNGNYFALDGEGQQIPEEQGSAWLDVLQAKLDRGVITAETQVRMPGWKNHRGENWLVQELIASGKLIERRKI